ncbi:MAG TPA: response regulator [Anaerolineales bacterium]|nr:response regulator [Anaerolineales bacterium]
MPLVWIVDDDDEMVHAVGLMLKLLDCSVRSYRSARNAVEELRTGQRPDAFLLDINMPEVSGIDMLEFLRREEGYKDIPVVMLSSETTDVQVDQAMGLGANAYIFKPVSVEELEEALKKVLPRT